MNIIFEKIIIKLLKGQEILNPEEINKNLLQKNQNRQNCQLVFTQKHKMK